MTISLSVSLCWGWLSFVTPLPPSASCGRGPLVALASGSGVVPFPTSGGGDGGGDDHAAAITTPLSNAITTSTEHASTTLPLIILPRHNSDDAPLVRAGITPALLPMVIRIVSSSISISGRDHASEGLRGDRQLVGHSPPLPAAAVDRAARHGGGRPSAFANTALATVPPRPGPASLLPSSLQPQRGRIPQQGGRVGGVPRAARKTGVEVAGIAAARPVGVALATTQAAMQVLR